MMTEKARMETQAENDLPGMWEESDLRDGWADMSNERHTSTNGRTHG